MAIILFMPIGNFGLKGLYLANLIIIENRVLLFLFEPVNLPWSQILREPVDKRATDDIAKVAFINVLFLEGQTVLLCQQSRTTFDKRTTYRVLIGCAAFCVS